jgi:hypothetical protein
VKKTKALTPDQMTPDQTACYELLCRAFGGAHHVPPVRDWGTGIRVTYTGGLSTFDANMLTCLTVLAHDMCIRVSVVPSGPVGVGIVLHKRVGRAGLIWERHPTLEDAIRMIRKVNMLVPTDGGRLPCSDG